MLNKDTYVEIFKHKILIICDKVKYHEYISPLPWAHPDGPTAPLASTSISTRETFGDLYLILYQGW